MNLSNKIFELISNEAGLADAATVLTFSDAENPYCATYQGPNIIHGQVIVAEDQMLYHALDSDGELRAGAAQIQFANGQMTLDWRWLNGPAAAGRSVWRDLSPDENGLA